jgi:C2 domain
MKVVENASTTVGLYSEETYLAPCASKHHMTKRAVKHGEKGILHRTKPYPDPDRPKETKWLSWENIEKETLEPSTRWIEVGDGDIGKVYVELLGCDELPNLDKLNLNPMSKTDAFANIIYESNIVNTDVINNSCSPRWPCWSTRAFIFNISHPSSDLYIGILDHDSGKSPVNMVQRVITQGEVHDAVSRTVVSLSKYVPNTTYTLKYPLYYGELEEHRKEIRGYMTLRIRIEWNSVRQALITGLMPPPPQYVSCCRKRDFHMAHYTADGVSDFSGWSIDTFRRHIQELQSYLLVLPLLQKAAMTLLLWRGHYQVKYDGKVYWLPLHSITAFSWAILIAFNFNRFPSFCLFCIGWFFLACQEHARAHPSPWRHSPHYLTILRGFVTDEMPPQEIPINVNKKLIEEYDRKMNAKKEKLAKQQEFERKEDLAMKKEMGVGASGGEVDITTKEGGLIPLDLNPLKFVLYPIQLQLGQGVIMLRIAKSVVQWEEPFYAFWITTISFVGSIAICWIPWGWVLRWVLRIVLIAAFGPWMAIVDRRYFMEDPNLTEEEREEVVREKIRARYQAALESGMNVQISRERALKLQAMKKFMFGQYLLRVPRFIEDPFMDHPAPESYATPINVGVEDPIRIVGKKYSQNLDGDMIPKRQIQASQTVKAKRGAGQKGLIPKLAVKVPGAERIPLLGMHPSGSQTDSETSDNSVH